MNFSLIAIAVTVMCMNIHRRPYAKLGPIEAEPVMLHDMDVAIGTVLSIPIEPARLVTNPPPDWLGWRLMAPRAKRRNGEGVWSAMVRGMRISLAKSEIEVAGQRLGDGADALADAMRTAWVKQRRHQKAAAWLPEWLAEQAERARQARAA